MLAPFHPTHPPRPTPEHSLSLMPNGPCDERRSRRLCAIGRCDAISLSNARSVRMLDPFACPFALAVNLFNRVPLSQALESLQLKRAADHAYFRDVIKRQRRLLEQVSVEM